MKHYHCYLLALSSLAVKGLECGGFSIVKNTRRAAKAACARYPSSIIASIHGHKHGLRWGSNFGPDNVSWTLNNLPAWSYWHHRFLSHQAWQVLQPDLVLGLHLQHILFPWDWLWGFEGWAWAVNVEHLEVWAMVLGSHLGLRPRAREKKRKTREKRWVFIVL